MAGGDHVESGRKGRSVLADRDCLRPGRAADVHGANRDRVACAVPYLALQDEVAVVLKVALEPELPRRGNPAAARLRIMLGALLRGRQEPAPGGCPLPKAEGRGIALVARKRIALPRLQVGVYSVQQRDCAVQLRLPPLKLGGEELVRLRLGMESQSRVGPRKRQHCARHGTLAQQQPAHAGDGLARGRRVAANAACDNGLGPQPVELEDVRAGPEEQPKRPHDVKVAHAFAVLRELGGKAVQRGPAVGAGRHALGQHAGLVERVVLQAFADGVAAWRVVRLPRAAQRGQVHVGRKRPGHPRVERAVVLHVVRHRIVGVRV